MMNEISNVHSIDNIYDFNELLRSLKTTFLLGQPLKVEYDGRRYEFNYIYSFEKDYSKFIKNYLYDKGFRQDRIWRGSRFYNGKS